MHGQRPNAKEAPQLYKNAKIEHIGFFELMVGPVARGFQLTGDQRFSFKFHSGLVDGVPHACENLTVGAACGSPLPSHRCRLAVVLRPAASPTSHVVLLWQFRRAVEDLARRLPAGQYQMITLKLIAACIAFGKALFTFTFTGSEGEARGVNTLSYGKWDKKFYSSVLINDIMEWLLDEDAVPTTCVDRQSNPQPLCIPSLASPHPVATRFTRPAFVRTAGGTC